MAAPVFCLLHEKLYQMGGMYMEEKLYAYGRVSTREQNLDRQMIAFQALGVPPENIFVDKQSGKDFDLPAYQKMLTILEAGDTLTINIKTRYLIQSYLWV